MNRELPKLLRQILDSFPTIQALAAVIGVSPSRLGRAMKGQDSLNVLSCLRLAQGANVDAGTILRAAGKTEIADLLERLYGQTSPTLPAQDGPAFAKFQSLTPAKRRTVEQLLTQLAVREKPGPKPRGHRSSTR